MIMGIVNVTPDSFSDGGRYNDTSRAIAHALDLKAQGADILDIGGESTRPGADEVPIDVELSRVLPVIDGLRSCGLPLSIDTRKPEVMRAAIAAGVDMVNDICGLSAPGALDAVLQSRVAICLMHMQGTPQTMQASPEYRGVVAEVSDYLGERLRVCLEAGISKSRLIIDPGFCFGKRLDHNLDLLRGLSAFSTLDVPVLVGLSRKSMLGQITGRDVTDRKSASLAAALLAAQAGAAIIRVHDVAETRDTLAVWQAVTGSEK